MSRGPTTIFRFSSARTLKARELLPDDEQLEELDRGERDTDNLSPYPGVVVAGERVNHDEFMRRALLLTPIDDIRRSRLEEIGAAYLSKSAPLTIGQRRRASRAMRTAGLRRCSGACCRPRIGTIPSCGLSSTFLKSTSNSTATWRTVTAVFAGICRRVRGFASCGPHSRKALSRRRPLWNKGPLVGGQAAIGSCPLQFQEHSILFVWCGLPVWWKDRRQAPSFREGMGLGLGVLFRDLSP